METQFLLYAFGAYMLAGGFGVARRPDIARAVLEDLKTNASLTYVTGAFTFFLGAGLIYTHNRWGSLAEGFISLFGWAAAFEGLVMLAAPSLLYAFADRLAPSEKAARVFGFMVCFLGLTLLGAAITR